MIKNVWKLLPLLIFLEVINNSAYSQNYMQINLTDTSAINIPIYQIERLKFEDINDVPENSYTLSDKLIINDNHPNPFYESTSIDFEIQIAGSVLIKLFNINGLSVKYFDCGNLDAGKHSIQWDRTDQSGNIVPVGVYFYEIRFGSVIKFKNMIYLR